MKQKIEQRETWIDIAKGILIVFVIYGHATQNSIIKNLFSSFYMPCFFILSGWLMKKEDDIAKFIRKKIKGVILPYIFFSLIWILFCFVKSFIIESNFNIYRAFLSIIIPYSGSPSGNVYNLWFLPCLFLSQILVALFVYKKTFYKIIIGIICIIFAVLGLTVKPYCSLLIAIAVASIFVVIGYYFSNYFAEKIKQITFGKFFILIFSLIIVWIACFVLNGSIFNNLLDFSAGSFGVIPIYLLGAISASFLLIGLSYKMKSFKALEYMGKNSLVFYALHYEVLAIVSFMLMEFIKTDLIATTFTFVITLFATTLVVMFYNKLKIGKLFR